MTTAEQANEADLRTLTGAEATLLGHPELSGKQVHRSFQTPLANMQTSQHKIAADLAKHNLIPILDANGAYAGTRPMTKDEMDPAQRSLVEHREQLDAVSNTRRALIEAQTKIAQAKLDPNSPTYKLEQRKIDVMERVANARMAIAGAAVGGLDLRRQQFDRDTWGSVVVNGVKTPVAGALVDAQTGQTIGLKTPLNKISMPTEMGKNKAEQGRIIINQGNELIRLIDQNRDRLGAWDGRVSEGTVDLGISDPVVREIYTRMKSYAALQPQLHGARGIAYAREFEDAAGKLKDNPDSAIASINALNSLGGEFVQQVSGTRTAHGGDSSQDLEFINKAMQLTNPKTKKNYTEIEARQALNRAKATKH